MYGICIWTSWQMAVSGRWLSRKRRRTARVDGRRSEVWVLSETARAFHTSWMTGFAAPGVTIDDLLLSSSTVDSVKKNRHPHWYVNQTLSTGRGACKKKARTSVVGITNLGNVPAKEFSIARTAYSGCISKFRMPVCVYAVSWYAYGRGKGFIQRRR